MKIQMDQEYQTRDGRKVILYTTTADNENYPVHGCVDGLPRMWTANGYCSPYGFQSNLDLLPVRKKATGTLWANVYVNENDPSQVNAVYAYANRDEANMFARINRFACIPLQINCEQGEEL